MSTDPRGRWFRAHRHHGRRGPESHIQAEVADWFANDPDTVMVERERALLRYGAPGRRGRTFTRGHLRPDVVVWSVPLHARRPLVTVVECKALTACEEAVRQIEQYIAYLRESVGGWADVAGVLAAPDLCPSVIVLPPEVRFSPIPDHWWRAYGH